MEASSLTAAHVRRGALFLVNIGVPLVVGAWRDEPVAALLGAVVGMLLAYDLTVLSARGIAGLLTERLEDILLGCAIALVGTAVAFPREAVRGFDHLVGDSPPRE
jgi:urea transporter